MLDTVFLMLLGGDAILLLAFIHSLRSQERNEIPLLSNEALLEFQYLGQISPILTKDWDPENGYSYVLTIKPLEDNRAQTDFFPPLNLDPQFVAYIDTTPEAWSTLS